MTILITGGAGYIGSHTITSLAETSHDIIVLDNFINSSPLVQARLSTITGKNFEFNNADICDLIALREVFKNNKITAVMHFAGLKSVSESSSNPVEYYKTNVVGTINLLQCITEFEVDKFIFSSSATVYGSPEYIPLDENAKVGGTTNPYGSSKYFCEQILQDYQRANSHKIIINLRYFNPVGAHSSGLIGEDPVGIPNNLVPFIYQVAVGRLECVNVYGTDYPTNDGTGVRDYIHVMDLAEGHVAALTYCNEPGYACFNLGTGKGYSVLEVITCFEEISGVTLKVTKTERRSGDIAECWSNPGKANHLLRWSAKRDLKQMLVDGWNWQLKNPEGYI